MHSKDLNTRIRRFRISLKVLWIILTSCKFSPRRIWRARREWRMLTDLGMYLSRRRD